MVVLCALSLGCARLGGVSSSLGMRSGGSARMRDIVAAGNSAVYERGVGAMGSSGDDAKYRDREYVDTRDYNQYGDINEHHSFQGLRLWQRFDDNGKRYRGRKSESERRDGYNTGFRGRRHPNIT